VRSALHTNDAPKAITRLTEMGIEPFLVASALDCVVAQRLARTLCPHCKRRTLLAAQVLRDSGFVASFDLEAYAPGAGMWLEVSSVMSNQRGLGVLSSPNAYVRTAMACACRAWKGQWAPISDTSVQATYVSISTVFVKSTSSARGHSCREPAYARRAAPPRASHAVTISPATGPLRPILSVGA